MTLTASTEKAATGLPKAARDLLALAAEHGWGVAVGRDVDSGGNPFLEVALRRHAPEWEVRAVWHSRATGGGSLRLFSLIWRHIPLNGRGHYWQDAPSLKVLRQTISSNPVVAPFPECRRPDAALLWPRKLHRA